METVSFQRISDAKPTHIITTCEDTDTCPGCGAGYKVGLSACEYCRRPVRAESVPQYSRVVRDAFGRVTLGHGGLSPKDMLAYVHTGEAIIPKACA